MERSSKNKQQNLSLFSATCCEGVASVSVRVAGKEDAFFSRGCQETASSLRKRVTRTLLNITINICTPTHYSTASTSDGCISMVLQQECPHWCTSVFTVTFLLEASPSQTIKTLERCSVGGDWLQVPVRQEILFRKFSL